MSKSVLVTGGAGFIGSHLVERLLATGDSITVLDNFNDFYDPAIKRDNITPHLDCNSYTLAEGDIRDADFVNQTFKQSSFDRVIHLAAMAGVRPSIEQPGLYADVNLMGSVNIFSACRDYGVSKLVFASSSSVYGNNQKVPFSETDPVDHPISPYAATKKSGELLAHTFHHLYGIPVACLRFFTVYGPRQRPEMAIHRFAEKITGGKEISVFGDGSMMRDYTYIDDIIDGVMGTLKYDYGFEIFNLGRGDAIKLSDLIGKMEAALGQRAIKVSRPEQPGDVEQTLADISKAGRLLGYAPKVSIDDGLKKFSEWYLNKREAK